MIHIFIIIFIILIIIIFYYNIIIQNNLSELIYYEKDCIDYNSQCSKEIRRRFNLYAKELDDFDIIGKKLNLMNVKILPNPGNNIAKYHFYSN